MNHDHRPPNRDPPTWAQRFNPFWWASDAKRDMAWGWLAWFLRNPFANFTNVIIGIAHRHRTVYFAKGEGWTFVYGWNYGWLQADDSILRLPFISHRGTWLEWAIGWMTNGGFCLTLRNANAKQPGQTP